MIKLTENIANTFVLTLTEKVTLSTPKFLFHFKSVLENQNYYTIIADTSSFTRRYNEFSFTEGTDDALNGSLTLGVAGQYEYFVYEQSSTTNLDPDNATTLVESGFMVLDRGKQTYTTHTINEEYTVHTPT